MHVIQAHTPEQLEHCFAIRHEVFVIGQNVPPERERDGQDDGCAHFLLLDGETAIGAGRVRIKQEQATIGRVAVLEKQRGRGAGNLLMQAMIAYCLGQPSIDIIVLGAQMTALAFYEKLGFTAEGEVYMDAGMPHRKMVLLCA